MRCALGLAAATLAAAASSTSLTRPAGSTLPTVAGYSATAPPSVRTAYRPPVIPLRVVRPFIAPLTRYGPGHRGVDLAVASTAVIRAAAAGVVTFAGSVAGRGVVVILHPDGIRTEYEPVRAVVRRGSSVLAGQVIGRMSGIHPGCAGGCLHWGARRGDQYVDPLGLLRPLGPVRLLPW
ncbi:MAG: M23 family metallopeptidase [Actinomycetota bacterium]|nr:M23 family metallopeptidase [Actinomycetota bacterium]